MKGLYMDVSDLKKGLCIMYERVIYGCCMTYRRGYVSCMKGLCMDVV